MDIFSIMWGSAGVRNTRRNSLREKLEFPRFLSLILDTVLGDEPFTVRVASSKPSPILLHYSDFKFYEIFVITSCS